MANLALTQSAAQAMLETYGNIVKAAIENEYSPIYIQDKLKEVQKILVERATDVYRHLGFKGGTYEDILKFEEKLNNKIKIATENSNKIGMLSGMDLNRSFIKDLEKAEIFNLDIQDKWENFWNMCVQQVQANTNSAVEESLPMLAQTVANMLFPSIKSGSYFMGNKMLSYLKEGVHSEKLNKDITKRINLGRINETFAACGPKIRQAFMKYLEDNPNFNNGSKNHFNSIANFEEEKGSTLNGTTFTLTLNTKEYQGLTIENMLKMRQEEREKVFAGLSEGQKRTLVDKINMAYRNKILETCSGANQLFLKQAIDKVIKHSGGNYWDHALGLFSSNAKDLTGILGEIQGIYFLLEISDGELINEIDWLGGINNPHTDILLGKFGAQVKNTTKNISSENYTANFQKLAFSKKNRSFNDGLYEMTHTEDAIASMQAMGMTGNVIPPVLMNAIENLLGMESFNVEYQRVKERMSKNPKSRSSHKKKGEGKAIWMAKEMGNPDFSETRSKIVEAANDCQLLMGLFASKMMYMQIAEISKGESNSIYIAGGAIIISAASIIGGMIEDLESVMNGALKRYTRFNTAFAAANQKGSFTIVDMINSGGDKSLNNINFGLQSSYTFIKH